jgi:excisionase family DNA binding protein
MINVKEASKLLGVSERVVYQLLKNGDLVGYRVGKEWRTTKEFVEQYLAEAKNTRNADVQ